MVFRRFVIIFFLLTYTNFLGLVNAETTRIFIPLKDYSLLFVIFYIFNKLKLKNIKHLTFIKPLAFIVLMATLVIISMPLRGETSLMNSFKYGRLFYVLLISYIVSEDVYYSHSTRFISQIITTLAIYFTTLAILNIIAHNLVARIFVGGSTILTDDAWDTGGSRFVLKSNAGILFIHLGLLLNLFEYINTRKRKQLYLLIVLSIGILLQGWRAPMITTMISGTLFAFRKKFLTRAINFVPVLLLSFLLIFSIERISQRSLVLNKFISAYNELTGEYSGSFEGRMERALQYQIPMFLEKKWFGYGFVHKDTELAKKIGHTGIGIFSLYYFDFGYFTLLNMFGIVGLIIFMYFVFYLIYRSWKISNILAQTPYYSTLTTFTIALVLSNYSFGAFISAVGLLPLAFIAGLAQGHLVLYRKSNNPASLSKTKEI